MSTLQATPGVASRAWALPLHSLLAPEAQLKVLELVRARGRGRVKGLG